MSESEIAASTGGPGKLELLSRVGSGLPWRLRYTSTSEPDLRAACNYSSANRFPGVEKVTYPLDLAVVDFFKRTLPWVQLSIGLIEWETAQKSVRAVANAISTGKGRIATGLPYDARLYDYQTRGAMWLARVHRGILADEPGLGKTLQSLAACDIVDARRVLILTVNENVQNQWEDTINRWNLGTVINAKGTTDKRLSAIKDSARFYVLPITVLSGRSSGGAKASNKYEKFLLGHWDAVIVDEAHMLQGSESARTRMARKLNTNNLWLLTGTPIWNRGSSLWSLLNVLNKSRWSSEWEWLDKYFTIMTTQFGRNVGGVRPSMLQQLKSELNEVLLRRTTEEIGMELPRAITLELPLEMPEDIAASYKRLKSDIKNYRPVFFGGQEVEINSPIQMLFMGRAYLNDPSLLIDCRPSHKLEKSIEAIEEIEGQVLAFTWHTNLADNVAGSMPDAISFHGKLTQTERANRLQAFKDGEYRVLVASMASLGVGVDLPKVDAVIFLECDWTPAIIEQSWRRIYRITSTNTKLIYFMFYKGTVEEHIYKVFASKQSANDELLAKQVLLED